MNPITKVLAISAIYFPQFIDELKDLDLAAGKFESWIFESGKKRLDGDATYRDGHIEAYKPYSQKRFDLLGKLTKYAAEEFK